MLQNSTRNLNQQDRELVHVSVINKLLLRLKSSLCDDEPSGGVRPMWILCGLVYIFYKSQLIPAK